MSLGGVFNLVLRDDRYDKFLTVSDFLRRRFDKIRLARKRAGEPNVQPTFGDVAQTHRLLTHATYRPYVAIASEYARVKPDGGDGATALGAAGGAVQFSLPNYGHFTSDIALCVRFAAVGSPGGAVAGSPTAPLLYRYAAYPGVRLAVKTEFHSNGVLLDDYTRDEYIEWTKHFLKDEYRVSFDRATGQQELKSAEYYNSNGYTGVMFYRDGPQTPKAYQPPLEVFVPLQFWMCRDPSQALLNDLLPNTQRKITVTLAPLGEILQAIDPSTGDPVPLPFTRLAMEVSLAVNCLYVNPEIHDIFASRMGFQLIRVHRRQVTTLQTPSGRVLQDQLKYPAEYLTIGVRDPANLLDFDNWCLMGRARPRTEATALMCPAAEWDEKKQATVIVARRAYEASTLDPVIDTLGVTAHGITLYAETNRRFFNSYISLRYFQGSALVATEDTSTFFVPFCLTPGAYEPSGYYNLSIGRELYVIYGGTQIGPSAPAEMVTCMTALNFLIRKGDSCVLRYAL